MTKTIKCTNPTCESLIPVEEGMMQIICPNCNTWHFPSTQENAADYPQTPAADIYGLPPTGEDMNNNVQVPVPPPVPMPEVPISHEPVAQPINNPPPPSNTGGEKVGILMTERGERLLLKEGKNLIGRKNSDLIIDDKTISRKHCIIEVTVANTGGWEYTIYDIGHLEGNSSTNGVFVSGRSLRLQDYERIPIGNGTSIRIGNVRLTLQCN